MASRKPGLPSVLYTASLCTVALVAFSTMGLAGQQSGLPPRIGATNKLITVRSVPSTPDQPPLGPGGRPAAMSTGSSAHLPDGPAFPVLGHGSWHGVPGAAKSTGSDLVTTYSIEVEDGVHLADGDARFGDFVENVLEDPRSWGGGGEVTLRRVEHNAPDLRIRLASQTTARRLCGFELPFDTSCRVDDQVYVSAARWIRGAKSFGRNLDEYRQYVVNHEVGHFLGHGHALCSEAGGPAPVMMQQTFSTHNDELAHITAAAPQQVAVPADGKVCTPNSWPYPRAGR
ncbi:DUF3152 domain-containing protein [Umezawaea sp. NPDC059074]|uniref:DUF3152 domain-containing protein n=1 Tax=Umezawaea sp. NPDC059074 TaxID=3346716 RepID=UPI0036C6E224